MLERSSPSESSSISAACWQLLSVISSINALDSLRRARSSLSASFSLSIRASAAASLSFASCILRSVSYFTSLSLLFAALRIWEASAFAFLIIYRERDFALLMSLLYSLRFLVMLLINSRQTIIRSKAAMSGKLSSIDIPYLLSYLQNISLSSALLFGYRNSNSIRNIL